jgi:hypothetical protein
MHQIMIQNGEGERVYPHGRESHLVVDLRRVLEVAQVLHLDAVLAVAVLASKPHLRER